MPLTNNQIFNFFTQVTQMAILNATIAQLAEEGIVTPDDLKDFDKDSLKQVADSMRNPGGRIPHPDAAAPEGSTVPRPPFIFGAKSQKRMLEASEIVRYYSTIGRPLTSTIIKYEPTIQNFTQQWKALEDRRDGEVPEVPKVTKSLPIIKWTEAFVDFLSRKIGVRKIPLIYTIRDLVTPAAVPPVLATDLPHSTDHGLVEGELIARASHEHPLYRDDNAQVY